MRQYLLVLYLLQYFSYVKNYYTFYQGSLHHFKYKNVKFKWWARFLFSDVERYALDVQFYEINNFKGHYSRIIRYSVAAKDSDHCRTILDPVMTLGIDSLICKRIMDYSSPHGNDNIVAIVDKKYFISLPQPSQDLTDQKNKRIAIKKLSKSTN